MNIKPACVGVDPELFFPISYGRAAAAQVAAARAVCGFCPLRDACLQDALEHEHRDGIWGGTTPDERNHLRPKRQVVLDRPELDEQVAKLAYAHLNLEQQAEALQVSVAVVRRCSRRNRARKSVTA